MRKEKLVILLVGLLSGFANGIFGSGGGMILVPAMERFMKLETHKAHATAISIMLPLSVLSALIYAKGGIEFKVLAYVTAGGLVGGYIGAKLLKKITAGWLHKIFGAFIIAAAVRMIF